MLLGAEVAGVAAVAALEEAHIVAVVVEVGGELIRAAAVTVLRSDHSNCELTSGPRRHAAAAAVGERLSAAAVESAARLPGRAQTFADVAAGSPC